MSVVTLLDDTKKFLSEEKIPSKYLEGKRHLTAKEVYTLISNRNVSSDPDWQNVWVSSKEGEFCAEQISQSEFYGCVVLGAIRPATLKYHDLELKTGIFRSFLENVVIGDDCVVRNVSYLSNYILEDRVLLFNIQEMTCTNHAKFGEGILKEGESESNRIWIGVGNENDGRSILPFENMIPADAFLWSRYREDTELMQRFIELTESNNTKKLDTIGFVGHDAVIKNSTLLKDAKIGPHAYIKGAFKLKNITVLSSYEEESQIGEGVELVNGIMGYGSRIFYQAVAVRFVIGRNCQLKYGARLLNSVLGDNSTVSCCEMLNNLVFPFHEQHHNSSFLIASTVLGQSNIASGATIGSNHNSRSPDGEMYAGRGFWPGLCSDFKHNSKFASFVLVSKGSYQNELNVTYPFSLVSACTKDNTIHILPAYWFLYNMFAIARNSSKFQKRDKRFVKVQHIETNPLAPDTMQECLEATTRLIELTARFLKLNDEETAKYTIYDDNPELHNEYRAKARSAVTEEELLQVAKDYLHRCGSSKILLVDDRCQKKYGSVIYKPVEGYREYIKIAKYYAVSCLIEWCEKNNKWSMSMEDFRTVEEYPLYKKWLNAGGQVIPEEKIFSLFEMIKNGQINSWDQVHGFYDKCFNEYTHDKARVALYIFEELYSKKISEFTKEDFLDIKKDVTAVAINMLEESISTREKDYTDFFRTITFRNKKEMEAVLGTVQNNSFLKELRVSTETFIDKADKIFATI